MKNTFQSSDERLSLLPNYTLKRSGRKTLSVEITEKAEVIVRAPLRLPQREIDRFLESRLEWINTHLESRMRRLKSIPQLSDADIAELKERAKVFFPERTAYFSKIMRLYPTGVKITSAKTRFGSCSPSNGICFSWRLLIYPAPAIDYVVVHELAHIAHKNHGKAFYALIGSILPDYKERRQMLKNI